MKSFAVATTMLCSVDEFRRYARIDGSAYDYLNADIIDQISGHTYRLWDRLQGDPTLQYYNEYYDIDEEFWDYIIPDHSPVIQVVAMTLHVQGYTDTAVDADSIYFDDLRIGIVERFAYSVSQRYQGQVHFGSGRRRVWVCYQAGLASARLLPLKLAIYAETAAWLNRVGIEGLSKVREGASSFEVDKETGWCKQAESIIKLWGN